MGGTISFLEAEKKTWITHTLQYDGTGRETNLHLLSSFINGDELHLASTHSSYGGISFKHYFVTNGRVFLEFGAAQLDIYQARVQINTNPRNTYEIEYKCTMNSEIRQRMSHVLGVKNYSLCLRNCEHVANYVCRGKWVCRQMETEGGLWKAFRDYMLDNSKVLVNTAPDTIRPHLFKNRQRKVYDFLQNYYTPTNFEYYLDHNENTFNVLVIGPTGAGKSRFINVLFNSEICDSEASLKSVTKEIYFVRGRAVIQKKSREVIVADTIGLCDTEWDEKEVVALLKDRINSNFRRIHAVAITVEGNRRFERQHIRNIKEIMKWLDYEKNHLFFNFILTKTEQLTKTEKRKIRNEFKETLGLTADTIISLGNEKSEDFDTVICTGFPPAHAMTNEMQTAIKRSFTPIRRLLFAAVDESRTGLDYISLEQKSYCHIL